MVFISWVYRIWIFRSSVLVPDLIRQRLTWAHIYKDSVSGIIITTFIIFSFLSLVIDIEESRPRPCPLWDGKLWEKRIQCLFHVEIGFAINLSEQQSFFGMDHNWYFVLCRCRLRTFFVSIGMYEMARI